MSTDEGGHTPGGAVEVSFSLSSPDYPFVGLSERESCAFELVQFVPRGDGRYAEFFRVSDARPETIFEADGGEGMVEARLVAEHDDGGLFEFVTADGCPVVTLAELGALPQAVSSEDGRGRICAQIPHQYDSAAVVDAFLDAHPTADLDAKRERDHLSALFDAPGFGRALQDLLTDRQLEVVAAAYDAGYYEWPRETTGEAVADDLDIASATFSQHLHAAERKLVAALLDS